jgi:hypothetical protein
MELVFSDGACGSLKQAQYYGQGAYSGGCIGVFIYHEDGSAPSEAEIETARQEAQERERLEWEQAVPLGGKPEDVLNFGLYLGYGDISEAVFGEKRRKSMQEGIFSSYGSLEKLGCTSNVEASLQTIFERLARGEGLRIWYGQTPDELCGYCWFLFRLVTAMLSLEHVSSIALPMYASSCGSLSPAQWHSYLSLERPVTTEEANFCAQQWKRLQKENAPLRAVVNGQPLSVPKDFYDSFLRQELELMPTEFQEAKLIGRVLGIYQLNISDWLLADRIEAMVQQGKLEVVTPAHPDGRPSYHRVLRKI